MGGSAALPSLDKGLCIYLRKTKQLAKRLRSVNTVWLKLHARFNTHPSVNEVDQRYIKSLNEMVSCIITGVGLCNVC